MVTRGVEARVSGLRPPSGLVFVQSHLGFTSRDHLGFKLGKHEISRKGICEWDTW